MSNFKTETPDNGMMTTAEAARELSTPFDVVNEAEAIHSMYGLTGAEVLESVGMKLLASQDENDRPVARPIAVVSVSANGEEFMVWFQADDTGFVERYEPENEVDDDEDESDAVDDRATLKAALDRLDLNTTFERTLRHCMTACAEEALLGYERAVALPRPVPDVLTVVEAAYRLSVSTECLRGFMDRGDLSCLFIRDEDGEGWPWIRSETLDDFWGDLCGSCTTVTASASA